MGPTPRRSDHRYGESVHRGVGNRGPKFPEDRKNLTSMSLEEVFTDLAPLLGRDGRENVHEYRQHFDRIAGELPSVVKDLEEIALKARIQGRPERIKGSDHRSRTVLSKRPLERSDRMIDVRTRADGRTQPANAPPSRRSRESVQGMGHNPAGPKDEGGTRAFRPAKLIPLTFAFLVPVIYFYVVLKVMFKITITQIFNVSVDAKTFFIVLLAIFTVTMVINGLMRVFVLIQIKRKRRKPAGVMPR